MYDEKERYGNTKPEVPTECDPEDIECPYGMSLIWEASTEIQSGDVLIVRIDDRTLRRDLSDEDDSG
ncbi:hypothetical protein RUM43_012465 [Polyplax serrata]|uniref:Uncharacterized protein n=1 Tax=Polyplax serrata TaxID=468196 RepID=A0AAN8S0D8_POLSC